MEKNRMKSRMAKGVEKLATYAAVETVGKSFPLTMHEVELSEDLRAKIQNLQKKDL
ncbi:MAG: hypothetical protein PWP24_158 [Clostridiales bacterium]|nr:hypothetical protein [Clostridiales bacterium]